MEINISFFTGLGCGLCLGLSLFAFRKFIGPSTAKSVANKTNAANSTNKTKKFRCDAQPKLVYVVRTDLNMTKGKIAAQCGHATVDVYKQMLKRDPDSLRIWERDGETKITLKTDSFEEVKRIESGAKKLGIVTALVRDEGRTQIAPNTVTVLGIGPAPKDLVDKVTGHLKLL